MKKVLHGLMAAAFTFGLAAAPAFAAVSPRVESVSKIEDVATKSKKKVAKKAPAKKKTQTAKKSKKTTTG